MNSLFFHLRAAAVALMLCWFTAGGVPASAHAQGEDNVVRWVRRAKQKDAGVFTSEIGFDETKAYVQKVMNNYRVYQQLYTADLKRK